MEDEALCSHYGWTPTQLDEQPAYVIEAFKAILIGKNEKGTMPDTPQTRRQIRR